MTDTFEMMLDIQLAERAGVDAPAHIERQYSESLAELVPLWIPPQVVIRIVEEYDVRIPPPPLKILEHLEHVAASGAVSEEARLWLRKAREAHELLGADTALSPEIELWLSRVKAARPGIEQGR